MRASDLMSRPAITCNVNDTLELAAKLMWDHDCGAVAVVREDGKLTGMITDRDIAMAGYHQGRSLDQLLVNGAMSQHIVSARPDDNLEDIEQRMAEHQLRRIPIVDADNHPLGLISLNDIAIETAQPDTRIRNAFAKLAHTLAAICRRRSPQKQQAA